jgi:hypothetical protein
MFGAARFGRIGFFRRSRFLTFGDFSEIGFQVALVRSVVVRGMVGVMPGVVMGSGIHDCRRGERNERGEKQGEDGG